MRTTDWTTYQGLTVCCGLSVCAGLALLLLFDGSQIAADATQALSVARNLQAGRGASTDIIYYEEHYQLQNWPVPQTVFPLGFPLLVALLANGPVSVEQAALLLNAAAVMSVPPLICLLAIHLRLRVAHGVVLALLWLCCPVNWWNPLSCLTEMPFVALTLLSAWALSAGGRTDNLKMNGNCWLAGTAAAGAFLMRYAGLFWIAAAGLALLWQVLLRRPRALKRLWSFCVVPVAVVIAGFARNHWLVGDLKGGNNLLIDKPFLEVLQTTYYSLSSLLGVNQDGLMAGRPAEWLGVVGVVLLTGLILRSLSWRQWRSELFGLLQPGPAGLSLLLFVPVTVAALFWLERTTSITLNARMYQPLLPVGLLLAGVLWDWFRRNVHVHSWYVQTTGALLLAGFCLGQIQAAPQVTDLNRRLPVVAEAVVDLCRNEPGDTRTVFQQARLLSDQPHYLAEVLDRGVVGLTPKFYSSRQWNEDEVVALLKHYQISHVVVFPGLQPEDTVPFFDRLNHRQQVPSWLVEVASTEQILVYRVGMLPKSEQMFPDGTL